MTGTLLKNSAWLPEAAIREALAGGLISEERASILARQLSEETRKAAYLAAERSGSSLSIQRFQAAVGALGYRFAHGFRDGRELQSHDIHYCLEAGSFVLRHQRSQIARLCRQAVSAIRWPNERFREVTEEQIPRYLRSLEGPDGWLRYHCCKENLDYPLLDGLPLDHGMYGLAGTDLVRYYLFRLVKEQEICRSFQDEVPQVSALYAAVYRIPEPEAVFSLAQEVIVGCLACWCGEQRFSAILCDRSSLARIDQGRLPAAWSLLKERLSQETYAYLERFAEMLREELERAARGERLIAAADCAELSPLFDIRPDYGLTDRQYRYWLKGLRESSGDEERSRYLRDHPLGFTDYLDLLDSSLLNDRECNEGFARLSLPELTVLCRAVSPMDSESLEQLFEVLESSGIEWQLSLARFLNSLSPKQQQLLGEAYQKCLISYR